MALPRAEVQEALGAEPANVLIALERCALAPLLATQLQQLAHLAGQPRRVDAAEYAGLLEATRALALLTLRNLGRQGLQADLADTQDSLHLGRYAAAMRFMELHAHRTELDAQAIARAVGCSRTRLYEAFAAQGETVIGALRELRLQRARTCIEQSPRLHGGRWRGTLLGEAQRPQAPRRTPGSSAIRPSTMFVARMSRASASASPRAAGSVPER